MGELLAEKYHQRPEFRRHPQHGFLALLRVDQQLTAIILTPVRIQIGYHRQYPILLAPESIQMFLIKITWTVVGKMTLKRE